MPQIGEVLESSISPSEQSLQTLFEQKEKLWFHIKNEFDTLGNDEKYYILTRILGQSIEDGFKLMQDLGLDNLIFSFFFQEDIQIKHPKLFQKLQKRMQELGFPPIMEYPILSENQVKEKLHEKQTEKELLVPEKCQILLDEIDSYYARVLSQRVESEITQAENKERNTKQRERIQPKLLSPEKQKQRDGMDMGVSALERIYLMAEPHYYTKDFIDEVVWPELKGVCLRETYLYDSIVSIYSKSFGEFDKAKFSRQDFEKMVHEKSFSKDLFLFLMERYMVDNSPGSEYRCFFRALSSGESFLSEADCRSFFSAVQMKASYDVFDRLPKPKPSFSPEAQEAANAKKEELEQKLKKIRYRGDLVDLRLKKLAEEKLLKELQSTLKSNQTLEQDPQTGEYAIYEQGSTQKEQVEQELSLENLREFFDLSKWTQRKFDINPDDRIVSIQETRKGDFTGTITNSSYGDEGFRVGGDVFEPYFGNINIIDSPDQIVSLYVHGMSGRLDKFDLNIKVDKYKIRVRDFMFKKILKETFIKIRPGVYCVDLVGAGDNEDSLFNLTIQFDPSNQEQGVKYEIRLVKRIYFNSKNDDTVVSVKSDKLNPENNNALLIFSNHGQVKVPGECDMESIFVGTEYLACVLKSTTDNKYYLLNTKDPALEDQYKKGNYGEAYDKIIPVLTAQGKVELYLGIQEDKMKILRPNGSNFVNHTNFFKNGVHYVPKYEFFCTAIETPQGMGAIFYKDFLGRCLFTADGKVVENLISIEKDDSRQLYSQACGFNSFAVLPEESTKMKSPSGEVLSKTLNLNFYDFRTSKNFQLNEVINFTGESVLFSVNNDYVTIAGQDGHKFKIYRRPLSEFKENIPSQKKVNERTDEKRKLEHIEFDDQKFERLQLLNMLIKKYTDPKEFVKAYEEYYYGSSQKSQDWLKQKQTDDPGFLSMFKRMIQKNPKEFLKLNTAELDSASPAQIDWILSQLYPQEMNQQKTIQNVGSYSPRVSDFLRPMSRVSLGGESDPRKVHEEGKELVRSRTELKEPLVQGIYGKYKDGHWEQISLPITPVITEPSEQKTFSISVDPENQEYLLPKSLHSKIIPERVHGVTGGIALGFGKKEIPLHIITEKDGSVWVKVNQKDIKEIVYSEIASKLPPVPQDVSSQEYNLMKRTYIREQGSDLIEDIAPSLPPEWIDFLGSIKELSPLEQVMEIQNFVRTICYYDFDNSEMKGKKEGKPFQERLDAMKYRMDELKKKTKDKVLSTKQIAGICGDFASLNAALLRKAGFLSVVVEVFIPQGNGVKTSGFHAVAGFVWPGENGEYHLFLSDATPSGTNEKEQSWLSQIQQPSIEKQVETQKKQVKKLLATEVAAIEKRLQELQENPEAISQLQNGVLEQSVNVVLQHGVKKSHCNILEAVLGLARYGNIDIGQEIVLRGAIEDQLLHERGTTIVDQTPAGTKMFFMFEEYLKRFVKSKIKGGMNRPDAVKESLRTLTKIIDIASPHLEKMEQLAARAILTDLQAKHMKK